MRFSKQVENIPSSKIQLYLSVLNTARTGSKAAATVGKRKTNQAQKGGPIELENFKNSSLLYSSPLIKILKPPTIDNYNNIEI